MENARIVPLIGSLLRDQVQSISQCACIALGRIAVSSDVIAQAIIDQPGLLAQAAQSLQSENAFTKRSAAFVMRAVAMHSSEHAKAVVGIGALESIGSLLEDFDPSVKESAAWSVSFSRASLDNAVRGENRLRSLTPLPIRRLLTWRVTPLTSRKL